MERDRKIPFHSTYEISESQTGNFGRMERAQSSLACVGWRFKQFEREHTKRRSREEPPARMTSIFHILTTR